jgi:hypothetical protein
MAYLGKTPSQAVRSRYYYTATGGETSLSGSDDNSNVLTFTDGNYVDVSLNGVALVAGTDYNTTTTNTIAGLTALVASDVVEVIVYDTFSVFGGNMAANLNFKDNVKANFGTGNDLQIFHDGSNSIIRDAGTGSLKFQYGTSDGVVFDSSGNVGIGTSSPSTTLDLVGNWVSNTGQLSIDTPSGETYSGLAILNNGTPKGFLYHDNSLGTLDLQTYTTDALRFKTNNAERMRIDSSGSILIGKTVADSIGTDGIEIDGANDRVLITRSDSEPLVLNRKTSDGDIAIFRKDGSTVGSIGTVGGDLIIGTGDTGLYFYDGATSVIPWKISTNAASDNYSDLGHPSYRWKDLYLSGGVYLGGTGSANHLDDYEEGSTLVTATPSTSGTITLDTGIDRLYYTKVGRLVTLTGLLQPSAVSSPTGTYVTISPLPFTVSSTSYARSSNTMAYRESGSASYTDYANAVVLESGTSMFIYTDASTWNNSPISQLQINISYITD